MAADWQENFHSHVDSSGVRVQLRNVDTGQLAGYTTSGSNGSFSFSGMNQGNYVIEIVNIFML